MKMMKKMAMQKVMKLSMVNQLIVKKQLLTKLMKPSLKQSKQKWVAPAKQVKIKMKKLSQKLWRLSQSVMLMKALLMLR